jgi:hypothetical protein
MLASCLSKKSQKSQFRQKSGGQNPVGIMNLKKITAITVQTESIRAFPASGDEPGYVPVRRRGTSGISIMLGGL